MAISNGIKRPPIAKRKDAPKIPLVKQCSVPVTFGNLQVNALVDTGATYTLCSQAFYDKLIKQKKVIKSTASSKQSATTASGTQIFFSKEANIHFKIGNLSWTYLFLITDRLPLDVILGWDFLTLSKATIDTYERTLAFPYGAPSSVFLLESTQTPQHTKHSVKIGSSLTPQQSECITNLINKFPDTITTTLGRTNLVEYSMKLNTDEPIRSRPYQYAPPKLEQLRAHVDDLLYKGVITPSDSRYSSPAFLVPKKGGKTRMVIDYRRINTHLKLDSTPMPTVESAFQHLGQANWFTLIDLNQSYLQIPLDSQSSQYTSFVVPFGQYEFKYLPFGLASGSNELTKLIDKILGDIKYKFVFAFFDDLCVYTTGSFEDHLKHVEEVLTRLQRAGLTVNPEKLTVAANSVEFLGHLFSNKTVTVLRDRCQVIDQFPTPKSTKQVSRFLGMAAYYSKFISKFSELAAPLNQLKRKGAKFVWGPSQQSAFDAIRKALASQPILRMPDFSKQFILQTDASGTALGAALLQEHNGLLMPVAYGSRPLNKHELNYGTLELECLAVVFGLTKFQQYLEHREFLLHTDCSALSWLLNHPRQVSKISRWIAFINSFKFEVMHIPGKDNVISDCLSRLYENEGKVSVPIGENSQAQVPPEPEVSTVKQPICAVLLGFPEAFKDIQQHQREDPALAKLIRSTNRPQGYSVQDGALMFQLPNQRTPRVVLPDKLIDMVFKYYHQAPTSAHLGIKKTLNRIERFFWHKDLKTIITSRVKSCILCQRSKQAPNSKMGHLASDITTKPFERIFIDHIGKLPTSKKGNRYLLCVIDAFSKFTVLLPCKNTKAQTTAYLLTRHVFSHFGFPKFLVSDNVSSFRSRIIQQMCMESGIQHIYTSPYYPKPSHAERANKNLKVAFRIFHHANHQTWDENIHWFQVAFNTAKHESTGTSPAELFLSRPLLHPLELTWNLDQLVPAEPKVGTQQAWDEAIENLRKARQKRERQYNKDRIPVTFQPGDWVMYRLHPLSNAADNINYKLMPLWSKPCVIERFTTPVTVRLINPTNGKLQCTAHVSHLKRFFMPKTP